MYIMPEPLQAGVRCLIGMTECVRDDVTFAEIKIDYDMCMQVALYRSDASIRPYAGYRDEGIMP